MGGRAWELALLPFRSARHTTCIYAPMARAVAGSRPSDTAPCAGVNLSRTCRLLVCYASVAARDSAAYASRRGGCVQRAHAHALTCAHAPGADLRPRRWRHMLKPVCVGRAEGRGGGRRRNWRTTIPGIAPAACKQQSRAAGKRQRRGPMSSRLPLRASTCRRTGTSPSVTTV